jgi:hypothetical protein
VLSCSSHSLKDFTIFLRANIFFFHKHVTDVLYYQVIFIGNAVYKSYTPSYYLMFYFYFLFSYYNSLDIY